MYNSAIIVFDGPAAAAAPRGHENNKTKINHSFPAAHLHDTGGHMEEDERVGHSGANTDRGEKTRAKSEITNKDCNLKRE